LNQIGIPEVLFQEIYSSYLCDFQDGKTYRYYCELYKYDNPEQLRSLFRRERKRRTLPSKHDIVNIVHTENNKSDSVKVNPYLKFMDGRKLPKILIFDEETLPLKCFTWGIWDQNISHECIINDWVLLGWSAKYLFDSVIMSDILTPIEAVNRDDLRITKSLWDIINDADILVGHNIKGFDIPSFQTRCLFHKLNPPSFSRPIDTLEISRKNFRFSSNKLDSICGTLNLDRKRKTDMDLWIRCDRGDPEALLEMQTYNKNDVHIAEDYYVEVRPWVQSHPNMGIYDDNDGTVCRICGGSHLTENGFYYTNVSKFVSLRCDDCGALNRKAENLLTTEERKLLLR
jgi:hypothetical protein